MEFHNFAEMQKFAAKGIQWQTTCTKSYNSFINVGEIKTDKRVNPELKPG